MKKRTVLRAVLGAALAVAGSLAVLPSAAQAAYACKTDEVCIYSEHNLRGSVLIVYGGEHNFYSNWKFFNGETVNDHASSIINRTSRVVFAYPDFDNRGTYSWISPGYSMEFTGSGGSLKDNTMSSIYVF